MQEMPTGKPTEQTTLIVCQCGSVSFAEEKRTSTAVVFRCAKCHEKTSVQGRAAVARMPLDEVTFAVQHVVSPEYKPKVAAVEVHPEWIDLFRAGQTESMDLDNPVNLSDEQRELLETLSDEQVEALKVKLVKKIPKRWSFTPQEEAIFDRWMAGIRILNHGEPGYMEQTWQSKALAMAAADGLAGLPQHVHVVLDAIDEAVDRTYEDVVAQGKKWTRRKETKLRNDLRDALCQKYNLGIYSKVDKSKYEPEPDPVVEEAKRFEQQRREERAEQEKQDFIIDNGYLHRALSSEREERMLGGMMLIGGPENLADFVKKTEEDGGFLLRVDGDPRTRTKGGQPVQEYVWLEEDDPVDPIDFTVAYLDEIDEILPDAQLEVVELLPENYAELEPWDMPAVADRREQIRYGGTQ